MVSSGRQVMTFVVMQSLASLLSAPLPNFASARTMSRSEMMPRI
jgi:hypothetical protein